MNEALELSLIVQDAARTLSDTMHAPSFRSRYFEVLKRSIFAIIRKQRELGVPAEAIVIFLTHFLRTPRETVEWQMACYDVMAAQATA